MGDLVKIGNPDHLFEPFRATAFIIVHHELVIHNLGLRKFIIAHLLSDP
jgi:hypothetical protein